MYEVDISNEMFNDRDINNEKNIKQLFGKHFPENGGNKLLERPEYSNPFNEYFSRGMLECTGNYLSFIAKMHVLMRDVYEKFSSCQKNVADNDFERKDKINLFEERLAKYKLDPESISKIVKERRQENAKE
uniref:Uncharacterized protein n=1 Tax=Strongyloides venezuelensis TaxID=75913 RepID=A0A0K0FU20_STRVS